jgi:hypothetical protein
MKNKFLQISVGVSIILLSASLFVCSISPAKAATPDKFPAHDKFIDQLANQPGKYQMFVDHKGFIYLGNTQTGKIMYWNETNKNWAEFCSAASN